MNEKSAENTSVTAGSASRVDRQLDVTGALCPEPAIRTRAMLASMSAGERLEVVATDPLAEVDLTILCDQTGHHFESCRSDGDKLHILIRAGLGSNR